MMMTTTALSSATDTGEDLLPTKRVAKRLNTSEETLCRWRKSGRGPKFIQSGNYVRYRSSDIDAWLSAGGDKEAV